jgi:hypothetical protein
MKQHDFFLMMWNNKILQEYFIKIKIKKNSNMFL